MVHIGKLIEHQLEVQGVSKSELARRLNQSPQNIGNIIKRRTIPVRLLKRISEALKYNFFDFYQDIACADSSGSESVNKNSESYQEYLKLKQIQNQLLNENKFLKILIRLEKKREIPLRLVARREKNKIGVRRKIK